MREVPAALRVALVSGGSRGLGHGIVVSLLQDGYRVATFSRRATPEVTALSEEYPDRFWFLEGDLASPESLDQVVHAVEETVGGIDILINNAGMALEGFLARLSLERIERLIDVNVRGTLVLTRLAARSMMIRRYGRIINISSIVGVRGFTGTAPYAATKGAIDAMTRALARELGGRNITVNSVAPGYLETEMTEEMNKKQLRAIVRRTPLGRMGQIEDVTRVILFLVSEAACFVSGQTIVVDGGLTA